MVGLILTVCLNFARVQKREGASFVFGWLVRCFDALMEGKGGQVPLLRSLRKILDVLPPDDGVS